MADVSWALREARRAHARVLRKVRWPLALFTAAVITAGIGVLHLRPGTVSGLIVGAGWASAAWAAAVLVQRVAGTSWKLMGDQAEAWTAEEVKFLERRGWHAFHRFLLEHADVDHVLVGPPGVFAVETKWSAEPWGPRDKRQADAASQAAANARAVRLRLQAGGSNVEVSPLVVVWGPQENLSDAEGVPVLPGAEVRTWLGTRPDRLDQETIKRAASAAASYVASRAAHEKRRNPLSRYEEAGLVGLVSDFYQALLAAVMALAVVAFSWRVVPAPAAGAIPALGVVLGLAMRRRQQLVAAGLGCVASSAILLAVYAVAVIIDAFA